MQVTPEETTTARFSVGVEFRPKRYEIWGPDGLEEREPGTVETKVIRGDPGEVEEDPESQELDDTEA